MVSPMVHSITGDSPGSIIHQRSGASEASASGGLRHESSRPSIRQKKAQMGGSFIKVEIAPPESHQEHLAHPPYLRKLASWNRRWIPNVLLVVVIFDSMTTCISIDVRASNSKLPPLVYVLMDLCVVFYSFEFVVNLFLKGLKHLKDWMTWMDIVVLICGYLEVLTRLVPQYPAELDLAHNLRMLRLVRIFRLPASLRKARSFRELQKMVTMLSTCLKTLAWSFVFCFGMMTLWSMLVVELVHPVAKDLAEESPLLDDDAILYTSSIMNANLLLFKTVIAGDSWGRIAVPIIRKEPLTALIFCGSLLTLVFGVMNLIVAVIVDTFAEARERDIMNLAEELELSHDNDKKFLRKIFERMDREGHGEVSLDDLVQGARQDPEFQSRLRVMDIDEVDLEQLFHMIDSDGSGTVEADEFIAPLSRWVHESKTATRFIKYNLMRAMHQQEDFFHECTREFNELSARINALSNCFVSSMSNGMEPFMMKESSSTSHQHMAENTESLEIMDNFIAAPDDEIEQPKVSKKDEPVELLRSALETAERKLAAGSEEALKRSLHVMEGVLQDLFRDLSLDSLDGEKISLLSRNRRPHVGIRSPSKERGDRRDKGIPRHSRTSQSEGWQRKRPDVDANDPSDLHQQI